MALGAVYLRSFVNEDIGSYLERLSQHFKSLHLNGNSGDKMKRQKVIQLSSISANHSRVSKDLYYQAVLPFLLMTKSQHI